MLSTLLNPLEEKVYNFILENPFLDMTDICKSCKLHRPLAYKIIKSLIKKNFIIIQLSGKKKLYIPENPNKIYDEFVNMEFKIKNLTRELKEKYNTNINKLKITQYQGKYAIRNAYKEVIENTKIKNNIYRIENIEPNVKLHDYYPEIYKQRAYEGGDINKYVILNESKSKIRKPRINRYTKIMSAKDIGPAENVFQVISDKNVMFVDLNSEQAFLFEGEKFAQFQKNIFKILYKKL